jgi:hypothetical protein
MLKMPFDMNNKEIFNTIILGPEGILWNRQENIKDETQVLLKDIGCQIMFIGHTPIQEISIIDSQIMYCDTGISRAFGNNRYQYIDIENKKINIKTIVEEN